MFIVINLLHLGGIQMRRIFGLFILVFSLALIVGCAGGDDSQQSKNESKGDSQSETEEFTKVKVGYMPNYSSLAIVVAAMNTEGFKEQGIEVELVEFADGPTIISAMESGSIDIGYIGTGAHVLPIQGEADIFAFQHISNAGEIIGNTENGVNTIQDLEGKKIAFASGTSAETTLNLTLEKAGLTRDDVELINMDASAIVTAMISGSVDAAATWSPNSTAIKEEMGDTGIILANNSEYNDIAPFISSWVVNPKYAEKNYELLVRYTKGLYKGMDYMVDNLDEVAEWVAQQAALNPDNVKKETGDGNWLTSNELLGLIHDGEIEMYYKALNEFFITEGRLTEDELVPVSDYVLFDIMEEAAE